MGYMVAAGVDHMEAFVEAEALAERSTVGHKGRGSLGGRLQVRIGSGTTSCFAVDRTMFREGGTHDLYQGGQVRGTLFPVSEVGHADRPSHWYPHTAIVGFPYPRWGSQTPWGAHRGGSVSSVSILGCYTDDPVSLLVLGIVFHNSQCFHLDKQTALAPEVSNS